MVMGLTVKCRPADDESVPDNRRRPIRSSINFSVFTPLRANLDKLKREIRSSELPRTFADAAMVCVKLALASEIISQYIQDPLLATESPWGTLLLDRQL